MDKWVWKFGVLIYVYHVTRLSPYGIPTEEWPTVLQRVENHESYRKVAAAYGVSRETVRGLVHAARCGSQAVFSTETPPNQHTLRCVLLTVSSILCEGWRTFFSVFWVIDLPVAAQFRTDGLALPAHPQADSALLRSCASVL
jgi:Helix-turn-helix domain